MPRRCPSLLLCCVSLLALPAAGHAQQGTGLPDGLAGDMDTLAQAYAGMGNPAGVARMSDSDASCEQLYAESDHLQASLAAMPKAPDPLETSARMQESIMEAQKKAMTGMRAKSMASSLLGLVPGVGGIAGGLASSAMGRGDGGMGAMNDATQKMMKEMQEGNRAMMAAAQLGMRKDHVTQLFLARHCKVSTLDPQALATARSSLGQGGAGNVPVVPPRPTVDASADAAVINPVVGASSQPSF